jgi:hypothetical protein
MDISYVAQWLRSFILTVAVELAVAWRILRHDEPSPARRVALVTFASLSTHPLVWFVFPQLPVPGSLQLVLAESFAVIAEAAFYAVSIAGLSRTRAFGVSALANASSFAVPLALRLIAGTTL